MNTQTQLISTKHFSANEIIRSTTGEKLNINNCPNVESTIRNLNNCLRNLEQLRSLYGQPIIITSGYRCPELNRAVGGKPNSQHCKGEAVDLKWDPVLFELIRTKFHYDQLIEETSRNAKWIHCSWKIDKELERMQVINLKV